MPNPMWALDPCCVISSELGVTSSTSNDQYRHYFSEKISFLESISYSLSIILGTGKKRRDVLKHFPASLNVFTSPLNTNDLVK